MVILAMDRILVINLILLILLGLLMLASASSFLSLDDYGHPYGYVLHQLWAGVGLGILAFLFIIVVPLPWVKKMIIPFFVLVLLLLGLVLAPGIGISSGGAMRWLGFPGYTFQPSEFAKIALVLYLALWLEKRKNFMDETKAILIPLVVLIGLLTVLLILEPDIGTLGVLLLTAASMYFVAGGKIWHFGLAIIAGLLLLAILSMSAQYRLDRFRAYFYPHRDPQGVGYHIRQSLTAIATGGIAGKGLGLGVLKASSLPEPMNDSIFSVIAEEAGLIGVIVFLSLYAVLFVRSLQLAQKTKDSFSQLVVVGVSSWIFFQAMIHIGAVSGLLPFTGVPLPLVSYGGSNYIAILGSLGLVFKLTRDAS